MHWIMTAGKLVTERWFPGHARATYAGGFRFYRPMFIGASWRWTRASSTPTARRCHVSVHVRSGDPRGTELHTTTHCTIVYTALDADNHEVAVRPWVPRLPEDRALERHALDLIHIRSRLGRGAVHERHDA